MDGRPGEYESRDSNDAEIAHAPYYHTPVDLKTRTIKKPLLPVCLALHAW